MMSHINESRLRTPEDQEQMQGLWRQRHLRTPEDQERLQGLWRPQHLRQAVSWPGPGRV